MVIFHRTDSQVRKPGAGYSQRDGFARLARLVGRTLLWSCLLLLLIRGIITVFVVPGELAAHHGATVTVTQPTGTDASPTTEAR
jgi:hypothetical protein